MLKTVQERINELAGCMKDVQSSNAALSSTLNEARLMKETERDETQKLVLRAVEDVKAKLTPESPSLAEKVQELQSTQAELLEKIQEKERVIQSNVPPSTPQDILDLKPVLDKLDGLRLLLQASQKASEETEVSKEGSQILEVSAKLPSGEVRVDTRPCQQNVEKLLSIVQQESGKQTLFSQQQAESVRYLNELNNVCPSVNLVPILATEYL
jgi:hypothetical protein